VPVRCALRRKRSMPPRPPKAASCAAADLLRKFCEGSMGMGLTAALGSLDPLSNKPPRRARSQPRELRRVLQIGRNIARRGATCRRLLGTPDGAAHATERRAQHVMERVASCASKCGASRAPLSRLAGLIAQAPRDGATRSAHQRAIAGAAGCAAIGSAIREPACGVLVGLQRPQLVVYRGLGRVL
jgi:hypothetical protein